MKKLLAGLLLGLLIGYSPAVWGLVQNEFLAGTSGLVGAPVFSFTADSDTGLYRISAGILGITTDGVERIRFTTATDDTIFLGDGVNYETVAIPNCVGANALQYTAATNTLGCVAAGGGGAPTGARYWVGTADATLSAEMDLGALTTGLVLNTVAAGLGTPSTYAGVTCTNQFLTVLSASAAGTCTTATLAGAQFANQGTTTTILHGNAAGNPSWAAVSLTADITGTLAVGNGGTGAPTLTDGGILIGGGAAAITALGVATNGQIPIGDGVTAPVLATLTAGTGITITNAAGSITITNTGGAYELRGLVGQNDAVTPNTQYGYSADLVVLRNTSDGSIAVRTNTGTLTNDTGVAGSTANGRDQAGAFGASTWLHFYFIWNGTTLATLSSTVAPPTGPTLPAGYTHWAYTGAIYYNATPLLVRTRMRGSYMSYEVQQVAISEGAAIVETAVSLTTLVPPNAHSVVGAMFGGSAQVLRVRYVTGQDFFLPKAGFLTLGQYHIPNLSQQIFYLWAADPGVGVRFDFNVQGYTVPNGGE